MTGQYPGNHDTVHGACGKTWKQRGNTTGHCGGCHETFEGLAVFDLHRRENSDGKRICLPPESVELRGEPLRNVNGAWRGPGMPESVRKRWAEAQESSEVNS